MNKQHQTGFALPTVLIVSLVMFAVLMAAASAVVVSRAALADQYYSNLSKQAAESALNYAQACVRASPLQGFWVDGVTLRPNTDCDGDVIAGGSEYLIEDDSFRTTFSVNDASVNGDRVYLSADAKVELLRASDGAVWKEYTYTLHRSGLLSSLVATATSSGYYQVCGILNFQTWCWGNNEYGQLGDGTTSNSTVPVRTQRLSGGLSGKQDTDIAVGSGFACAISSNEVYCWGRNHRGQLGTGNTTSSSQPVKVDHSTGLAGKTLSNIVATESTVCVIASGDLYCWGDTTYGELGIGVFGGYRSQPVRVNVIGVSNSRPVTRVSTSTNARHICAVASSRAYCWGGNDSGEIGNRSYLDVSTPTAVYTGGALGTRTVTDISAGGYISGSSYYGHSCTVAAGNVYCWGDNQWGAVGTGSTTGTYTQPVQVSGLPAGEAIQVGAGYDASCALTSAQNVYCWGRNHYGQIGDGTNTTRLSPVPLKTVGTGLEGRTIESLTFGLQRGCVVASGQIYCWGRNDAGQLGDGTTTSRSAPTEAKFLRSRDTQLTY